MKMLEEKREKPLRSFILPNESFKWDRVLGEYADENSRQQPTDERQDVEQQRL